MRTLILMLARMQRVEVCDTIDAQHHGFPVGHKLLVAVLECGFDDPRIALGPVVAAPRDQPETVAVPLQPDAVAVVFDLVEPAGADGTVVDLVGRQNSKVLGIGRVWMKTLR